MTVYEQSIFIGLCRAIRRIAVALESIDKKLNERSKEEIVSSIPKDEYGDIVNAVIEEINHRTEETGRSSLIV